MKKVDLELVKMVLQRQDDMDIRRVSAIIEDINNEASAGDEEEKAPAVKKQFVIMVSDPHGELEGKDFVGWVLQIPEEESPATTEDRLVRSAYDFNTTPKGRRLPVKTIPEVCEYVPARITKEMGVWIRTKEPVLVLRTGGKVPLDEIKKLRAKDRDE